MRNITLSALVISLSGCSTYSEFSPTGAGVMAWNNDLSAALVVPTANNGGPKACMQMALTMNDVNSKTTASVSDSMLKIFEKIPESATPADLAKISSELAKTAKALNVSTERTAFLMVGGFYICQLQANGMSEEKVADLAKSLIDAASISNSENKLPASAEKTEQ